MFATWFNVSWYTVAIVVHVLAATALLGSTLASSTIRRGLLRASSLDALRLWLDVGRQVSRANPVMALIVLASGVYLGSVGWWAEGWFGVAVLAWLANASLAALAVKPAAIALGAAAGRAGQGPVPAALDVLRRSRPWAMAEAIMRGSDLAMIYLMFAKPPLAGACAALALAIGTSCVVEGVRAEPGGSQALARSRRQRPATS